MSQRARLPTLLLLAAAASSSASAGRDRAPFVIHGDAQSREAAHQAGRLAGEERWDAAWRLSRLGDAGAERLIEALGHADWRVVQVALYGLGELPDELAEPCRVADALADGDRLAQVPAVQEERRSALRRLVKGALTRTLAIAHCEPSSATGEAHRELSRRLGLPEGPEEAREAFELLARGAGAEDLRRIEILEETEGLGRGPQALEARRIADWLREVSDSPEGPTFETWARRLEETEPSPEDLQLALRKVRETAVSRLSTALRQAARREPVR